MPVDITCQDTTVTASYPHCFIVHARQAAGEALTELAGRNLSVFGEVRDRPEWWVGHLSGLLASLLVALEEQDD